ncbi:LysR family transcriptional regulator [Yinghuangia sp. ASG 101]|uniref:LysR family transcriptional regulator n=1 Tax=Yinghuangia sp. ASG 101 TaxID=2896848 RepID=UPI001E2EF00D|nr:LysR family transcriptional regulator [Yinghuangia sp. ASG 101]UGQ08910.1 LysR family transcriptional regulator [Yinghuangia sp. ASG 101]
MDLTLLRTFLAVHRAGSFTRAAQFLDMSQPTVTAQIRSLEKQIGRQLFQRLSRGVTPTTVADELAAKLAPHLDALEEITARDLLGTDPLDHTVHLAGPAEIIGQRVLPALADLVRRGLRLRVTLGPGGELLAGLAAGRHDIVVSDVRPRERGLTSTALADDEYVLVGAPRWAVLLPRERIAEHGPSALDDVPVIGDSEEQVLARRYWAAVFDAKPPAPAALVVPDLRAVLACVRAGAGIAVLPRHLCAEALADGSAVTLFDPEVPPLTTLFVALRAGEPSRPHLAHLHARLVAHAAEW